MTKTISRVISCFVALVLALSMFGAIAVFAGDDTPVYDGTSISESLAGEGTEASPYLIQNGADLKYFEQNAAATTGKYYKLTADIIWSNYTVASEVPTASNWTPFIFNGTFDGDGHYIAGINVVSSSKAQGLFSEAYGVIKNLTLTESYIYGGEGTGGLVGIVQPTEGDEAPSSLEIINCKNYASVEGKTDVGGIVGKAFANAKTGPTRLSIVIKQCVNYGTITCYEDGKAVYIGGITGRVYGYGENSGIYECVNYGHVVAGSKDKDAVVGGILCQSGISDVPGEGYGLTVSDCVNYGKVEAYRIVGGIIGRNYATTTVKNCVNVGEVIMYAPAGSGYEGTFGAIAGANGGSAGTATIENCFYLAGSAKNVSKTDDVSLVDVVENAKTEAELNSAAMATALGEKWTYNATDGLVLVAFATPSTPEVPGNDNTTTSGNDNTTKPNDNVTTVPTDNTTTVPADNTTTVPSDDDTTKPADDTTAKPDTDTTTAPNNTTEQPNDDDKGCGGFAVAAQLIAVLGAGLVAVVVKKKI